MLFALTVAVCICQCVGSESKNKRQLNCSHSSSDDDGECIDQNYHEKKAVMMNNINKRTMLMISVESKQKSIVYFFFC